MGVATAEVLSEGEGNGAFWAESTSSSGTLKMVVSWERATAKHTSLPFGPLIVIAFMYRVVADMASHFWCGRRRRRKWRRQILTVRVCDAVVIVPSGSGAIFCRLGDVITRRHFALLFWPFWRTLSPGIGSGADTARVTGIPTLSPKAGGLWEWLFYYREHVDDGYGPK